MPALPAVTLSSPENIAVHHRGQRSGPDRRLSLFVAGHPQVSRAFVVFPPFDADEYTLSPYGDRGNGR